MSYLWQVTVTVSGIPDTEELDGLHERILEDIPDTWGATCRKDLRQLRIFGEVRAPNKKEASGLGLAVVHVLLPGGYVAEVLAERC